MKPRFTHSLALLLVLAATVAGWAHRASGAPHPNRRETRAYFQANVLPVLRQQRQKLELQLTAPDRAQLAIYRTQLRALQEQGHALRQAVAPPADATPEATPSARPVLTAAQREQAHQLRLQARSIVLKVAQMAQQYEAPIGQLAQEVQPQKEKWEADIKAIAAKNSSSGQQGWGAASGRYHGREADQLRRFFKPVMFLLLDPSSPADVPRKDGIGRSSFFPNPASATAQLEYEVQKAGPVSVELLDKNGNKLRTLVAAMQQAAGSQRQQLDLSDLPAGTYFYRITTQSGALTERFVKE